ncbi:MAG TPA: hypothetical protein VN947_25460 [Polyangia bacterium]|nr:hypothetical protein [Polyangia bacterium]
MAIVFALALAVSIGLVVNLHGDHDHWPALGAWARPLEILSIIACVMMAVAIYRRAIGRRRGGVEHAARPGRLAFYVLSLAWLSSLFHDYEQGGSYYTFIIAFGLFATLDAFGPALARALGSRATDAVDLVCMNVCVLFVGLELTLRVVAAFVHAPLFAQDSTDAKGWLAANKLKPGAPLAGFRVNSRGFPDDEFEKNKGCLVTAVGDSFTVGVVPHEFHFTTVAERDLGCPVDAIGVCAVGPEEYQLLERDEALPLDPNVVVVDLFVGNDIVDNLRGRDHFRGGMRRWLDRHNMLVYELPRRLGIVVRERHRLHGAMPATPPDTKMPPGTILTRAELLKAEPWLGDPLREPPSMSREAFLELETRHAREICGGGDEPYYKRFWEILDQMRAAAAPRTLAVLLIPDEVQVEDPLWREVSARAGVPLDRDRAQRILAARLKEKGIPTLDLLPILRAQPVGSDGMRHLFHRQDSHLNARGNEVTGHALAAFLRPLVPAR